MAGGRDLVVHYGGTTSGLRRASADASRQIGTVAATSEREAKRTGRAWAAIGAGIAAVGIAAARGVKATLDAAGDAEQQAGAAASVFGKHQTEIAKAARTAARDVGVSRREYLQLSSVLGAGLKNKGIKDYAGQTQDLVKLGADLSAQFGGSTKQALEAISSLMRGEADPIEKYGVAINETAIKAELAAKGQDKLTGAALESAKAQARLRLLFKQTADAQGAFGRETDTYSHKLQVAGARWDDLKVKIGDKFLPAATKAMGWVSDTALPALERWVSSTGSIRAEWSSLGAELKKIDWSSVTSQLPSVESMTRGLGDGIAFLRRHSDMIVPTLKALAVAFLVVKGAQAANQLVGKNSLAGFALQLASTLALTLSNRALARSLKSVAASQSGANVAETIGVASKGRGVVATLAKTAAERGAAIGTKALAIAQRGLNLVMRMNPIGLIITGLILLGTALVLAYKKSATFRRIVDGVWAGLKKYGGAALKYTGEKLKDLGAWFVKTWGKARDMKDKVVSAFRSMRDGSVAAVKSLRDGATKYFGGLRDAARKPVRFVIETVLNKGLIGGANWIAGKLGIKTRIPEIGLPKGFRRGGYTGDGPLDEVAGPVHRREIVWSALDVARAGGRGVVEALRRTGGRGVGGLGGSVVWPTNTRALSGNYAGHSGIDIAAGMGAPVFATRDGQIAYAGWGHGYGQAIFERFASGLQMVYGHLSKIVRGSGAVKAGDLIGRVGSTGRSTGPHLHVEVNAAPFGSASNRSATFAFLRGATNMKGAGSGSEPLFDYKGWLSKKFAGALGRLGEAGGGIVGDIAGGVAHKLAGQLKDRVGAWLKDKFGVGGRSGGPWSSSQLASSLRTPRLYDSGGMLPTGPSLVVNNTGKPERVLNEDQWDRLIDAMSAPKSVVVDGRELRAVLRSEVRAVVSAKRKA